MADHSMDHHATHDETYHGGHGCHDNEMEMAFYASNEVTILFKGWTTHTGGQMFGACIGVFLFAFCFEALRALRERLYANSPTKSNTQLITGTNTNWTARIFASSHLVQTCLHGVQFTYGYLLMLIVMTYNVYVCIAVVLGATVGFLVFGWNKNVMSDITEAGCCG